MTPVRIVVVGLGYVGLPLAVALARKFDVIGLDIDSDRIAELREGSDRTREVEEEALARSTLKLTDDAGRCGGADVYIVTVPTPVDESNRPDLGACLLPRAPIAGLIDPAAADDRLRKHRLSGRDRGHLRARDRARLRARARPRFPPRL